MSLAHSFQSCEEDGGSSKSAPPFHAFEKERLLSLRRFERFARSEDPLMVSIACEATDVCATPIGMVSLLGPDDEHVLACVGHEVEHVERSASFCAYAILEPDVMTVEDTLQDPRFRNNPFVVGPPFVRFYAGAPILDEGGLPLGSVCAIDVQPHVVSSKCLLSLRSLAAVAGTILQCRLLVTESRSRVAPPEETQVALARLDLLLMTLLESRAPGGERRS